jgi:serine/threonine protein kinase
MANPSSLRPGHLVERRYRLREPIGVGGMGAVWAARDEREGRDVAVKFLHPALLRDPVVIQRFLQEADVGSQLRDASIVQSYGSGRYVPEAAKEPVHYLVTELLIGEPLSETLHRLGRLPPGPALAVMRDVARAADIAHRVGVLHRDLKPANVFLHRPPGGGVVPKVLDFGVSKMLDPAKDAGLTTTGMVVGSPAYMSPEQALGRRDIDARTDIWSIGAMLHRALTGQPLFAAMARPHAEPVLGDKHLAIDALSVLPGGILGLVRKCLRQNRQERFAHASDLADAIDDVLRAQRFSTDLDPLLPP